MRIIRYGLLLVLAPPSWAAYQYYLIDRLTSIDATKWSSTGVLSAASAGLAAPDVDGGSLISRIPIPDASNEAEVAVTIALNNSGGTFTEFLQATPYARTANGGSGTYLALEMQNPQFDSARNCAANFVLLQGSGTITTLLASFWHSCRNGMVMRLAVHGTTAIVWPDQADPMEFTITPGAGGQPGIGSYGTPAGNAISQVQLGTIRRAAPAAVDAAKTGVSAFRNRIELHWTAVAADATGSALAGYWIYRDGAYLGRTSNTTYADESVAVGGKYSYTVLSVDQHYNFSSAATINATVPSGAIPVNTTPPAGFPSFTVRPPPTQPRPAIATREEPRPLVLSGTPPADSGSGVDPRRVGIRALASYWGAAGEQIDNASGNLNFTLPLIKPMAGGGWGIGFALSYNSQLWRQDPSGTWLLGQDVGYGMGWKVQAGSIVPVTDPTTQQVVYYLFADSTGAEYSLSVNTGGIWTSQEGVYVSYEPATSKLHANDGSFWVMGCTSSGGEPDSGTMYPTLIQDSNGNQIVLNYLTGVNGSTKNSSARLSYIQDSRGPSSTSPAYNFTYSSDMVPHLTGITGPTGESYSFTYAALALVSPFNGGSYGTRAVMPAGQTGLGVSNNFLYNTSAEMTQFTTPLGGTLQWVYRQFTYAGSITLREVNGRSMSPSPGVAANSWIFGRPDSYDAGYDHHDFTQIVDNGTGTSKVYYSRYPIAGLPVLVGIGYSDRNAGNTYSYHNWWTGWTQDSALNTCLYVKVSLLDVYPSSTVSTTTYQTLDSFGNVSQQQVVDYNSNTVARTYNFTYLTDSNYISRYIRNRLTQATVTTSAGTLYLAINSYDGTGTGPLQDPGLSLLHDSTYDVNFTYRGNPTGVYTLGSNMSYAYQISGTPYKMVNGSGTVVTTAPSGSTDFSLPGVLTPNGNSNLATSFSYTGSFLLSSVSGPNGTNTNTAYDIYNRPISTTSADGAQTYYTYSMNQTTGVNTTTSTVNTAAITLPSGATQPASYRWTVTTLDGFGRTTRVQSGHDTSTTDTMTVDTQYAPCACSPLGKMWRVSLPYAPGATPIWTTYTYDGSGRTLTVTKPDGASVTTYSYVGNNTTTTDPAGKWKTMTTDAFGNLTTVTEPNPAGGANLVTTYTYNGANQLLQTAMPRNGYTQNRTFQWTGSDMTSTTNPENGTVTYVYDAGHHVTQRTDAKGQQTRYTYDAYGRLTQTQHYLPMQGNNFQEDPNQDVNYYYDTNPFDGSFSNNAWGRLTAVTFANTNVNPGDGTHSPSMGYMYSYNPAGRVTAQRLRQVQMYHSDWYHQYSPPDAYFPPLDLNTAYTWDNQGRMTTQMYPGGSYPIEYRYDSMGRLSTMAQQVCTDYNNGTCDSLQNTSLGNATYNFAGQLTSLAYLSATETRSYNSLMQLTYMSGPGMSMSYTYSATQNNGRLVQSGDGISGETVNYTYDALNRLATAATTTGSWAQSYSYDGFGNLTGMNGGAIWSFDPTTNRSSSGTWDANGNQIYNGSTSSTWDVENRMTSAYGTGATEYYVYDPWGKRVSKTFPANQDGTISSEVYFYGAAGQKVETFACSLNQGYASPSYACPVSGTNVYFGSKLVVRNGAAVATDRLGSVRSGMSFWPYGQERTSTANGQEKFATYYRDATGLDYAEQRYYDSGTGKFMSPDPENGGAIANPISMNLYSYTLGDPINSNDATGLAPAPTCGDNHMIDIYYGAGDLGKLSSLINGTSNLGILAEAVYTESSTNPANTNEKLAVADVILNRFMIVNGYDNIIVNGAVWGAAGPGVQGFGWANGSIAGIVGYPGQFAVFLPTSATQQSATLAGTATSGPLGSLTAALNSGANTATCADLENSFWSGYVAYAQMVFSDFQLFGNASFVPTSFNSFSTPGKSLSFEGNTSVNFGTANKFYGISWDMVQYNDGFPYPVHSPVRHPRPPRKPK